MVFANGNPPLAKLASPLVRGANQRRAGVLHCHAAFFFWLWLRQPLPA